MLKSNFVAYGFLGRNIDSRFYRRFPKGSLRVLLFTPTLFRPERSPFHARIRVLLSEKEEYLPLRLLSGRKRVGGNKSGLRAPCMNPSLSLKTTLVLLKGVLLFWHETVLS